MITSSFALGANVSYIYIRGEYFYVYRILEQRHRRSARRGMARQEHPRQWLRS
jgi:NADH-quinone oxidoreductase subunit F